MDQQPDSLPVEALFKAFAAISSDITYLIDENGIISHANQASEYLLGFNQDEILNTSIHSLIHPDDIHAVDIDMQNISRTSSPPPREIRLRQKNNTYIQLSAFHLADDDKALPLLQEAKKACLQAQALTSQLLTLSRNNTPIKQATKLNRIIEDICDLLPGNSDVNCQLTMAENLYPVVCDSKQINQVIQHLISNAS